MTEWESAGCPPAPNRPGEADVVGEAPSGVPIVRYPFGIPVTGTAGDVEAMALYAGQGVGLVHAHEPAADIVRALAPLLVSSATRPATSATGTRRGRRRL